MSRKKIGMAAGVLVLAGMCLPARRTNPPVTADFDGPAEVKAILRRSCYDCHSNETRWPWYSKFGPGSWLTVHDVNEGREHLNFSEWGTMTPMGKTHATEEAGEEIAEGEMPLAPYLWLHKDARLSDEDKAVLQAWVQSEN